MVKAIHVRSFLLKKEAWLHIVLWTLFFASIHVNWTESWVAESFLPEAVAPHIAIAVPVIFLLNTFWLIPNYLSKKKWLSYIWLSSSLLIGFEILRTLVFTIVLHKSGTFATTFKNELFGENSLVFGLLNVLTLNSVFYSFVYRFTRDWLRNQSLIETLKSEKQQLQLVGHAQLQKEIQIEYLVTKEHDKDFQPKRTFTVKKRDGTFLLKVIDIVYFQAQGDFVFAFDASGSKHIINESLKNINSQICKHQFFQINRSEIINFDFIQKFDSYTKNRLEISFTAISDILYTSNSRSSEFKQWVGGH